MVKAEVEPAAFRAALEAAARVLDQFGIRWWIQDGTLLGAVRAAGPIPGDRDIDLGIPAADFDPTLVDRFTAAGFSIKKTRGIHDRRPLMFAVVFGGVIVDVFGVYQQSTTWHYTVALHGILIEAHFRPFGLGRISFLGLDVPCPAPAESFLLDEYGPDWRTPVGDWHYAFSPFNLRLVGGPLTRIAYRLRYLRWRMNVAWRRRQTVSAAEPAKAAAT